MKIHGAEKDYKCNQCGFASFSAISLRMHLKIHSGEKSYKCNQCNYASSQASNLKAHLKIHRGEKPRKRKQYDFTKSIANTTSLTLSEITEVGKHLTEISKPKQTI